MFESYLRERAEENMKKKNKWRDNMPTDKPLVEKENFGVIELNEPIPEEPVVNEEPAAVEAAEEKPGKAVVTGIALLRIRDRDTSDVLFTIPEGSIVSTIGKSDDQEFVDVIVPKDIIKSIADVEGKAMTKYLKTL